ncbi:MAG: hypothetical protein JJU45_07510 [Acidimicrobiia bacterium]|nr:hypothetical protein [Acidimicrobiia bacterium]
MSSQVTADTPVVLVKAGDPVLAGDAARQVITTVRADADAAMAVDELGPERLVDGAGTPDLSPLVDAAQTPAFLTDRRVVVGRGLGGFTKADDVAGLVAYLGDPLPTTRLVLVWDRPAGQTAAARVPPSLTKAVEAAGGVVVDAAPGRKVADWVRSHLAESSVHLDAAAADLVVENLGDDAAALAGLLATLEGAHGPGARLGVADVRPYLHSAGAVPPWELTDAIDSGDLPGALATLDRLLDGGGRHPLQIMATLHSHYSRMMALEGAAVANERDAAQLLGLKGSTFPARKALEGARRMGHDRLADCIGLLATADLELRGARAWPDRLVMEVLVARLASRSPRRAAARG